MEVFISYDPQASVDAKVAGELSDYLRKHDITPVSVNLRATYGPNNVFAGLLRFPYRIEFFVVLLSKSYASSAWHYKELAAFLMYEQNRRREGMIVPVLIDNGAAHPLLEEVTSALSVCGDGLDVCGRKLISHLNSSARPKPKVFVVMRMNDPQLDKAYKLAMARAITQANYEPVRIDQMEDAGNVPIQILGCINDSEIVLADLTHERPNCYFEAGYASGLGRELILTIRKPGSGSGEVPAEPKVHFDLAGNRLIYWSEPQDLFDALTRRFAAIKERRRKQKQRAREGRPVRLRSKDSSFPAGTWGDDEEYWKDIEPPSQPAPTRSPMPTLTAPPTHPQVPPHSS